VSIPVAHQRRAFLLALRERLRRIATAPKPMWRASGAVTWMRLRREARYENGRTRT